MVPAAVLHGGARCLTPALRWKFGPHNEPHKTVILLMVWLLIGAATALDWMEKSLEIRGPTVNDFTQRECASWRCADRFIGNGGG